MQPDLPQPRVEVSLWTIYQQLQAVIATVTRIEERQAESTTHLTDHEGRLRGLERRRWPIPSLTVVTSVAALIVAIISATLKGRP